MERNCRPTKDEYVNNQECTSSQNNNKSHKYERESRYETILNYTTSESRNNQNMIFE